MAEYKFCPTCGGNLEFRIDKGRRSGPTEGQAQRTVVYACLGVCGTVWSLFDLELITRDEP